MSRPEMVLREVGALLGHPNPPAFAEFVLAPPCEHHGEWTYDPDEVCPSPCGSTHHWCACGRPMTPECPMITDEGGS